VLPICFPLHQKTATPTPAYTIRRKTLDIKIKDGNPYNKSKRQMGTQVDTTQRKSNQQKSSKDPMQSVLMATK